MEIALNWYCYPQNASRWDQLAGALSQALAQEGIKAADRRYQGDTQGLLASGGFTLAYCCGIDAYRFRDRVMPVAVPLYRHSTPGGHYHSVVLTRPDSPLVCMPWDQCLAGIKRGAVNVAVNQRYSWSGSLAGRMLVGGAEHPWSCWPETGGHFASLQALVERRVDLVFMDRTSWAFLSEAVPSLSAQAVVIGKTPDMPACPLVVPRGDEGVIEAVRSVLSSSDCQTLVAAKAALGLSAFALKDQSFWYDPFGEIAQSWALDAVWRRRAAA